MHLVVEIRQVVFVRPFTNLIRRAIGMSVVVVVVPVALVEPALVPALQLVVEDDALDVRAVLPQACLGLFVGAIDLEAVLPFAFARQARVEGLQVFVVVVSMGLEQAAAVLRQTHGLVPIPRHSRGLDQPLFAQMSQVAGPWISRAAIVVAKVTTRDHSERPNGPERARFGAAQGVLAITVVNQFALWSARQVDMACEHVASFAIAVSIVAVAFGPAGIMIAVASMPV